MKRTLMVFCSLLLVLDLTACGSRELNRQPKNSVSAVNSKQISLSSAENSEPIAQASMESREQAAFSSVVSDEHTEEVSVASDAAGAIGASSVSSGSAESESILSQQAQPQLPSSLESPASQESTGEMSSEEDKAIKLNLQIGSSTFTATLEENKAADSFAALMKSAPLVIQMSDYSGFEKVGSLGTSLPAGSHQITTQSGDIVLYNGNQIVIFYGSNSWSYTRLGKVDDLTGWEEALGDGDVSVTFSLG